MFREITIDTANAMIADASNGTARILVVDGNHEMAAVVTYSLALHGFEVATADTGGQAIHIMRTARPDLVLLERALPDMSGLDLIRRTHGTHGGAGIGMIILSVRHDEAARIEGLSAGADDYIGKPFSPKELVLRVRNVLHRLTGYPRNADRVDVADLLTIDRAQPRVWVGRDEVLLTPTEHRLLRVLADGVGHIRTRDELLEAVWHIPPGRPTRTVDVHVRRLRAKLGDAGKLIESVRGMGYRLAPEL